MHPIISDGTQTAWWWPIGATTFSLDIDVAVGSVKSTHPTSCSSPAQKNNPSGQSVRAIELRRLTRALSSRTAGILMLDEAYTEEFSSQPRRGQRSTSTRTSLSVTRTNEQGVRLRRWPARPYLIAAPAVIDAILRLVRLPYHLSSVTQAGRPAPRCVTPTTPGPSVANSCSTANATASRSVEAGVGFRVLPRRRQIRARSAEFARGAREPAALPGCGHPHPRTSHPRISARHTGTGPR